ncbi:rRNA maturation RNase YbeY [Mailhella massiliensis]|uniref:rRNA maturation RNase YbeY n=1 Tax=Mailhella massiliensis TaxID=1903261 RepID=UPI002355261D|nr:rRNA maturation RNase YbeY [Mailhella massiliensis]
MSRLCVEMRAPCRFCRREWLSWLSAMHEAAFEAGMLPGQENGPRAGENTGNLPPQEGRIQLIVASDGDIASVNLRNLGCSGPTNILSFPGDDGEVGTLFLSADTLERECVLYGQKTPVHAVRLLAHGMGHILGFDHSPEMDEFCEYLAFRASGDGADIEA